MVGEESLVVNAQMSELRFLEIGQPGEGTRKGKVEMFSSHKSVLILDRAPTRTTFGQMVGFWFCD